MKDHIVTDGNLGVTLDPLLVAKIEDAVSLKVIVTGNTVIGDEECGKSKRLP